MEEKIGIFKVISHLGMVQLPTAKSKVRMTLVECPKCLKEVAIRTSDATRNKSCGCTRWKNPHNKTHGDSRTKIHFMWMNMIARVDKSEHYKDISLCDEWRNDYLAFKEFALSHGYKEGLSIDRIDGTKNYEPNNVRFVTRAVQSANRAGDKKRKRKLPKGVYLDARRGTYFSSITVDGKTFNLGAFKTIDGARNAYNKFIADNSLQSIYPLSV